eukprot:jgi/Orpsp1_1/1184541/evm.model.c7180000089955.1
MKLFLLFEVLFIFTITSFTFGNPIIAEEGEVNSISSINENSLNKRGFIINYIKQKFNGKEQEKQVETGQERDVNTYIDSVDHFVHSKDIKKNVYYNGLKKLDVYYDKSSKAKKPVVIYIIGSLMYLSEKSLYSNLGEYLRDNDFVGVIPNYVQFPFGTINDMIDDISTCIHWVYKNIDKYGGDKDNIIILGHSSGAHLAALTLFESALGLEDKSGFSVGKLPKIQKAVLLNGVYDFDVFSKSTKKTGNISENSKFEGFIKAVLSSDISCPTDILKDYKAKSIKNLGANSFVIIHTQNDLNVPIVTANDLMNQIKRTSDIPAMVYNVPYYSHTGLTENVMKGDAKAQKILKDLLTIY